MSGEAEHPADRGQRPTLRVIKSPIGGPGGRRPTRSPERCCRIPFIDTTILFFFLNLLLQKEGLAPSVNVAKVFDGLALAVSQDFSVLYG